MSLHCNDNYIRTENQLMNRQLPVFRLFTLGFSIVAMSIALLSACVHGEIYNPNYPAVSFRNDVQLVLSANCTMSGCHDNSGAELNSLTTYEDVIDSHWVNEGNANDSKLYQAISGKSEEQMPPSGSLSKDQIRIIFYWIEQGAKDN